MRYCVAWLHVERHLALDARQRPEMCRSSTRIMERLDLDGYHGWKIADDRRPVVPGVSRRVKPPAGGAEVTPHESSVSTAIASRSVDGGRAAAGPS